MTIDLAQVDWLYVAVLAVLAFLASLVGNLLAFGNRGMGAVLSAILFAALFVGWTYYPHGLPLPTSPKSQAPAAVTVAPVAPAAPAAPAAPVKPRNPVTDITPPR